MLKDEVTRDLSDEIIIKIRTVLFLKISLRVCTKELLCFSSVFVLILGTKKNTQKANISPQMAANGNFVTQNHWVIDEEIIGPKE